MHVLVIAGLAFPLDRDEAKWLEQRIRTTCVDASHRPRDMDALACLQLADMLAEEHPGRRLEPIELTLLQARGLLEYVLEPSIVQEHKMQEFSSALWKFIRDNS